jgi:hypothetical protein
METFGSREPAYQTIGRYVSMTSTSRQDVSKNRGDIDMSFRRVDASDRFRTGGCPPSERGIAGGIRGVDGREGIRRGHDQDAGVQRQTETEELR